jgi:excisionase family DNA binding protein
MTTTQYISVRETAQLLNITEKSVMDLIEQRKLQAYRIANKFLRLKKSEVLNLRNAGEVKQETKNIRYSFIERISDFFYFNDFYILALMIMIALFYVIFYTE